MEDDGELCETESNPVYLNVLCLGEGGGDFHNWFVFIRYNSGMQSTLLHEL